MTNVSDTGAIGEGAPRRRARLRLGHAVVDDFTMAEATSAIAELVARKRGGFVVTPNVDHVVLLEDDPRLRGAYENASLSLADGAPIVWVSRLLGTPLREKVSGSDLILPLARLGAAHGWRFYLLGGGPGIAARAGAELERLAPGLVIAGTDERPVDIDDPGSRPRAGVDGDPADHAEMVAAVRAARPDVVLVALGCPKQEILMDRIAMAVSPAVCIGIGAGLDFVAGAVRRAPAWVSRMGLEWFYRLLREPRRLWRRYLVRDPRFLIVVLRELLARHR